MKDIRLDHSFSSIEDKSSLARELSLCHNKLHKKEGAGSSFLGWLDDIKLVVTDREIASIKNIASELKDKIEVLVVVGIGGSYLGARAVIEALRNNPFANMLNKGKNPLVLYAGHHLDTDYHKALLDFLENKDFAINVISKSGTTTEPALAFRLLKDLLEKKKGKARAKELIIATTDKEKGALRTLAKEEGYRTFSIPSSIGGRYSVLTSVGLLPIAAAGIDIEALLDGAIYYQSISKKINNPAYEYAALRNILYKQGKKIEILISYNPSLKYFGEWWKQLFGESEGKEGKGLFPATCQFTTDLHSMGQWIQESERTIFETIVHIENTNNSITIEENKDNLDNLNFLKGKTLEYINEKALLGTSLAHFEGNVPSLKILLPKLNAYYLGQLIYFFEIACAISGYLLGVNPFDQPGVEAYKRNMFALVGKPGFEEEKLKLENKLGKQKKI